MVQDECSVKSLPKGIKSLVRMRDLLKSCDSARGVKPSLGTSVAWLVVITVLKIRTGIKRDLWDAWVQRDRTFGPGEANGSLPGDSVELYCYGTTCQQPAPAKELGWLSRRMIKECFHLPYQRLRPGRILCDQSQVF